MSNKRVEENADDSGTEANYPRHTIERCLRIPKGVLDQNAGKPCTREMIAKFLGVGLSGELNTEISSASKYGLMRKAGGKLLEPTETAKKILRPQSPVDVLSGYRDALLQAPQFKDVYQHYRGENLPDSPFLENSLTDNFKLPTEKTSEFVQTFLANLAKAELVQEQGGKTRLLDVGSAVSVGERTLQKVTRAANASPSDTCFVVMPFGEPLGSYYSSIYKPAIEKAGLTPIRADSDIFGTGKIMDQVLAGILNAKVLVAELTTRNPNVFYELGVAHALQKPVVLVSATEDDVPFDIRHIRVIYYDKHDPFWGQKLLDKVAENVASAVQNPAEALLPGLPKTGSL